MASLLGLFLNNLLPILLAAAAGYLLARRFQMDPRPLSQVIFYIFSPCLLFTLLTQSQLSNGDILRMMSFAAANILLIGGLAWMGGRLFRLPRQTLAAVMLATMFMNAGNFGLPATQFAFGETALAYASLYFVTDSMLSYSLGVVIASLGTVNARQAFTNLIKVPNIYALALALFFMGTGWQIPPVIERTTTLLGEASVPAMLVLLGLQFQRVRWQGNILPLALVNGLRLIAAPVLAWMLSPLFGLQGPSRQAGILQSAMPTAVLTTVLATEYDADPPLVTATVFSTTLLSALTLTPILALLGG